MNPLSLPLAVSLGLLAPSLLPASDYEDAPFHYWTTPPRDPSARLQEDLRTGKLHLPRGPGPDALRHILHYFGISPATQVLVYSKTSAQNSRISPERPRAIYFSDDLYLGWVQGGGIELLSFDPHLGAVFSFVDLAEASPGDAQFITRPHSCLDCHASPITEGVPGGLVRSVFPGPAGLPFFQAGSYAVDDSTPLSHRWGGWYVTGSPGKQTHQGNALAEASAAGEIRLRSMLKPGATFTEDLTSLIDATPYPGGPHSDIVALMILEHQVHLQNLLISANYAVRRLHHQVSEVRASQGEPPLSAPEGTLARVIESQALRLVDALLFKDAFEMTGDGIQGSPAFLDAFSRNRVCAKDGRSLKDLRLYERLFKNRCSYTIYSQPFSALTPWLKTEVYRQLLAALRSPEGTPSSAHLSSRERLRILQILRETKTDLPSDWYAATSH